MSDHFLCLDAAAVARRLDRRELIEALAAGLRKDCQVPPRQHYQLEPATGGTSATLLIMPAWQSGGLLGVKLVTVVAANAARGLAAVHAGYLAFDATTGQPRAYLDGSELTLRRTGAASALASKYLSRADSGRLLMVGTGKLAPHLIESHLLTRPIAEVHVWGRRPDQAATLVQALARPGIHFSVSADLENSARWADIISCATLAQEPLIRGRWLRAGQHLDLVGAFTAAMREADDETIGRSQLFVDTRAGALSESGELIGAIARGVVGAQAVRAELSELVAGQPGRTDPSAITLFKSVGSAVQDLIAAQLVLEAT